MRENILPEEKLLRLIRGHKKSNPGIPKKFSFKFSLKDTFQRYRGRLTPQKIILSIFIFACLYLIFSLIYPLFALRKVGPFEIVPAKSVPAQEADKEEIKPFDFYKNQIGSREIFSSQPQGQSDGARPDSALNADAIKEINLVGIIAGDNPQAVIEDKKTQKSYYLSVGQSVGEIQIVEILEGKIILNYRGARYELYL